MALVILKNPMDINLLMGYSFFYQFLHPWADAKIFFVNNTNEEFILKVGSSAMRCISSYHTEEFLLLNPQEQVIIARHAHNQSSTGINRYEIIAQGRVDTINGTTFTIKQQYADDNYVTQYSI